MDIRIKRVYEAASKSDGYRVLVDRVWPRGLTKDAAHVDEWAKAIAPSTGLRKWFGHLPAKFPEFTDRYERELQGSATALGHLRALARAQRVTLVYGAKDELHNQAVVLRKVLLGA